MRRVVRAHLSNWLRRRRRADVRVDHGADLSAALDLLTACSARGGDAWEEPDSRAGDPSQVAAWREFRAGLATSLQSLDADCDWLWGQLALGRSLRELAWERGLSYDGVKRLRFLLLEKVRQELL
jgi:hypothetical protein